VGTVCARGYLCRVTPVEEPGEAPEERQIVLLSVLEGYTMREIAQMLELPQGTVSSKLHRTLKKLRRMLGDT
jgi:DNA-directed RNA polymerase specialized sigma24 family protein